MITGDNRAEDRRQRRTAAAKLAEEDNAVHRLMSDPAGRRWINRILSACHVYATCFQQNALLMAHAEGERNIGLQLIVELERATPDNFILMLRENADERRTRDIDDRDSDGVEPDD